MESYLFTSNPLSSKEDLRELLPDFVIQSIHCIEKLSLIKFLLETQYRNISLSTMAYRPYPLQKKKKKKPRHQSRCDLWPLRVPVHSGLSLATGRQAAVGARRSGNVYGEGVTFKYRTFSTLTSCPPCMGKRVV